jgi:hypothetical protein
MDRYREVLSADAEVDLVAGDHDGGEMVAEALCHLPVIPIDRDVLRVYGEVRSVTRHASETVIRVEIREAVQ